MLPSYEVSQLKSEDVQVGLPICPGLKDVIVDILLCFAFEESCPKEYEEDMRTLYCLEYSSRELVVMQCCNHLSPKLLSFALS